MSLNYSSKVQEMIKRKISVSEATNKSKQKLRLSSTAFRSKQFKRTKHSSSKNLNNNIVIMNMPPFNRNNNFQNDSFNSLTNEKQSNNQHYSCNKKFSFFSNPHINDNINKYSSVNIQNQKKIKNNSTQDQNDNFFCLKRYNSMDIRISTCDISSRNRLQRKLIQNDKINQVKQNLSPDKIPIHISQFKPSFKQLLKRNSKIHANNQNKLKKSDLNYQRAINTSCQSRKNLFKKILKAFQISQKQKQKLLINPQKSINTIIKFDKLIEQDKIIKRQSYTGYKSSRNNGTYKQKQTLIQRKQQQGCRPWSADKKQPIILKNSQYENQLQFYSINDKS